MTSGADEPVLYEEPGASWWALSFGPVFGLVGIGIELLTGPVFWWLWTGVAVVLFGFSLLWVYARRSFCAIRLTEATLRQGPEELAVAEIAEVVDADDQGWPARGRVLGGGIGVPRKYDEVALRLRDGSTVVAWARDGETMRAALRDAVSA